MTRPGNGEDHQRILIPFDVREGITLQQAAGIAGKTEGTIKNWCHDPGVGRKVGKTYLVSRPALTMYLEGDNKALKAYHAGDRSSPLVAVYFERAGLGHLLADLRKQYEGAR
jgi:hypothetical protein